MQKIQPTKRYYKMYKKGRFWVIAGITVMAAGISPVIVHADMANTATTTAITAEADTTGKQASSTPVPASAEAQSVAPVSTEQTGSAASTSAANDSSATSAASSASAPTSVAGEAGSQTTNSGAGTSAASGAAPASANESGSSAPANSMAPSSVDSGTPSAAASTAPSNESAAPASNAPETTSSAAATESTASKGKLMAKRALRAPAATVAEEDQDLSNRFVDKNVLKAVRSYFKLQDGEALTANIIKTYGIGFNASFHVSVKDSAGNYIPVTSLVGMEVLADFPKTTSVQVDMQLAGDEQTMPTFDFSPLQSLSINGLTLISSYWGSATDEQLRMIMQIDPTNIRNMDFSTPNKWGASPNGMTTRQFNILAPFIQQVFENKISGSQVVALSGNRIMDFSGLKTLVSPNSNMLTTSIEREWRTDQLSYRSGETVEVPSPIIGIHGESVNYSVFYYQDDGSESGVLVQAEAHQESVTENGDTKMVWMYSLVNPKLMGGQIIYGALKAYEEAQVNYTTDINGNPMSTFTLVTNAIIYQPVTDSKATLTFNPSEVVMGPTATWNYFDHIASATDYNGNPISQDKWNTLSITNVNGLPDLTKAGWQTVEFTFTDDKGIVLTATAAVNVLASQASIWAKADQIVWPKEVSDIKASDLVASVTDAYGNPVTDFTTVQMSALDAAKAGAQLVTLTYTDEAGNQVTATLNVTVDLATLATQPVKVVVGPNAKWKYEMNLLGVTDSLGQPLAVDKATIKVVTGPDLTVAKPQTVIFEYTDDLGRTQRFEAQVTTIQSQAAITANDDLIVWPKEVGGLTVAELVRNVTDMNGNAVTDLTNVTMSGVDSTKPGAQPITLTYTDAAGNQVTATLNVTVDLATLTTKDVQLVAGPTAKWDYVTNLTGATDSLGQATDVKTANVKVITSPDLSVAKPQTVILEYTDDLGRTQRFEAQVTTIQSQAAITANDDLIVWPKEVAGLTVAELVRSVTDMNGNAVTELTNVMMSDVDPAKSGAQSITLTYTDNAGNQVTTTLNVTVDLATLTTKDVQLVAGPTAKWDYNANLESVLDSRGQAIDVTTARVKVVTGPDLSDAKVGVPQTVVLEYTDDLGRTQQFNATVTTTKTQATITAKDDPIVWPAEVADLTVTDLVHSVTDANGQAVPDLTGVTMSKVDPAKAGVQPITLTYTDAAGNQVTTTINVTVDLASLTTKDSQLVAGPTAKWNYVTNLTGATDSLGQAVDVKTADVKVITGPDLSAALVGQPQTVVLEYTDDLGRTQRFNAVVTTTTTQASITAKTDQVVWPGDVKNLMAADLVHNVIDADGQAVTDLSNVTMSGVDATKAGVQAVTLTYTDTAGNRVTTTINVTVDLATLTTKDVQVVAGPTAKWDYLTSLTGATDSLGQVIDVKNARVQVVTAPNLSVALVGQSQTVTFEYTDNLGQTQRVSALVTTMKTQAAIAGRDVTVVAGPNAKWTLTDSLDGSQSFAADGSALSATDLAAVTTNITPNVQKLGTYVLTLSYVDAAGNLVTGTANVNVVASQAALQVQDSQIKVGANWQATDNLLRVVDSAGQPASIEQVTVTGTVDTTKAGIYPVTYKYTDAAGNVLERTANVTVVAEPTDPGNGGGTTDPGNGGGTTDPGNGGGTTDPGNGGGTTDPGNGGGTTDPGNGGGTTAPGNGGGTTDPDNGGGVAAPDNGDTISTQPEPVTPEPVADSSPVATPQPTVKKTTIQADQVRPATAALRSAAAAKTAQSSGLPQTDERRTGMAAMVAGLLGLTGLLSAWGATKRRQRK